MHDRVVTLLTTGESKRLTLEGDTVYLDLSPAVQRVRDGLNERGLTRVADAIPPTVDGRVTLLSSDGFVKARDGIHRLERLTILLPILALLCLIGHVVLSESKRRGLLRVALGVALTALLLLAAIAVGRTLYLDAINQNVLPRQAAADIFDALIVAMRTSLRMAFLAALILTGLALLAGRPLRVAVEKGGPALRDAASAHGRRPAHDLAGRAPLRCSMERGGVRRDRARRVGQPNCGRRPDRCRADCRRGVARRRARAQWTPSRTKGVNRAPGATRLHRRPDEARER